MYMPRYGSSKVLPPSGSQQRLIRRNVTADGETNVRPSRTELVELPYDEPPAELPRNLPPQAQKIAEGHQVGDDFLDNIKAKLDMLE